MILIIIISIFILAISGLSSVIVFGKYISDSESIPFLENHLKEYVLNNFSWEQGDKMLIEHKNGMPYISKRERDLFANWYIDGYGQIGRWTKASKIIDTYFNSLEKPIHKKTLKNL